MPPQELMSPSSSKRIKTAGISQVYKFINSSGLIPSGAARGTVFNLTEPIHKIKQALRDPEIYEQVARNFAFSTAEATIDREMKSLSGQIRALGLLLEEFEVQWRTMATVQQKWDKAMASLERLSKTISNNDWNSYKGKIEVGLRARGKYLELAKTTVEMIDKFRVVFLEQSFIQDSEDEGNLPGFAEDQWAKMQRLATAVFQRAAKAGIALAGPGGSGRPVVSDEEIIFNGKNPERYEDFVFVRYPERPGQTYYCKTENRPYQAAVIAFLKAAVRLAPDVIKIDIEESGASMGGDWPAPAPLA